nr:TonB-dependent receptor [Deltaproteobacteria bacterium]
MKQTRAHFLNLALIIDILAGYILPGVVAAQTCEEWVGKVVSVQGEVYARRAGETQWLPVKMNDMFCPGDMIRTQGRSRAAIVLCNETILRLDQKTTISFSGLEKEQTSILDLVTGAVHFFSRFPRGLKVITPFVNAAVEGTEFFIRVEGDRTLLSIFEGQVAATNEAGRLILSRGESAVAQAGQAPVPHVVVNPRDAVKWALYYPPVLEYRPADFGSDTGWQAKVRRSIEFYWNGDLTGAFSSLEEVPEDIQDPHFFTYRVVLLLTVGCIDEADVDIRKALNLDPSNSHAIALQSVIAVVQNQKNQALDLARKAVEMAPESPAARVALSYAQQADFDLQGALTSLREAVELGPGNALVWSRLSELWLSFGDLDKALEAAKEAVVLNPNIARTQTVLGFSYLTQIKIRDAKNTFEKAIELDQAAPLPRLGLGLAKIRDGDLKEGREEIEIAASLGPDNSLIRSYLGKAYYEEKRDRLAKNQFAMAKELDPKDPTAWFYDAIRKQSVNRPVEALEDLQKSIELNDNRAVYRSRLMLDEDLAARSVSLARIYNDLGFQQLALVEGWSSVNADPANYSTHRFLADSYAALPRHEIARVSELLQAQLLQPINITPLQPQLAESNLAILDVAGPSSLSFNEFNPLFTRNRFAILANGILGNHGTYGDDVVLSGLSGRVSVSAGQFHFETDGFRKNDDLEQDIYNAFVQVGLSPGSSLQVELRRKTTQNGDIPLRADDSHWTDFRDDFEEDSIRGGFHFSLTPHQDIVTSLIYKDAEQHTKDSFPVSDDPFIDEYRDTYLTTGHGYLVEGQHIYHGSRLKTIIGAGYFNQYSRFIATTDIVEITEEGTEEVIDTWPFDDSKTKIDHTNVYFYAPMIFTPSLTAILGASFESFSQPGRDRDQFNPKFGVIWKPGPYTTLRLAAFRVLKRPVLSNQTIELTQIAGFNQFFDDVNGARSWRYGIGLDQRFSDALFGGVELSWRDIKKPVMSSGSLTGRDLDEGLHRAYLYWTPHKSLALSVEYQNEYLRRDYEDGKQNSSDPAKITTHIVPITLSYYNPNGLFSRIRATYVNQKVDFVAATTGTVKEEDDFFVTDVSIGYRFPKRYGLISAGITNLFDQNFSYQSTEFGTGEPRISRFQPERIFFAKLNLWF